MSEDRVRVTLSLKVRATTTFKVGRGHATSVPLVKRKSRLLWFFPNSDDPNVRVVVVVPTSVDAGRVAGSKGTGKYYVEGPKNLVRNVLLQLSALGVDVSDALKALEPQPQLCEYVTPDGSRGKAPCGMADMEPYTIEGTGWRVTRHYDPEGDFMPAWDKEIKRDVEAGVAEAYELHPEFIKAWEVLEYRAALYRLKDRLVIKTWLRRKQDWWDTYEEQEWVKVLS